jgi:hypothetical protein
MTADNNAEGVALRIALKIEAAMHDSPKWLTLTEPERAALREVATDIGTLLAGVSDDGR